MSITAKCKECGTELDFNPDVDSNLDLDIQVEPCPKCLQLADEAGFDRGWTDGRNDFTEEDIRNAMKEALTKRSLR